MKRLIWAVAIAMPLFITAQGQQKVEVRASDELLRLQKEFIAATNDYKASLQKLKASYERDISKAQSELEKSKELYAAGMISIRAVEAGEAQVAQAKGRVAEVDRQMANADSQIAETLGLAEAYAKTPEYKQAVRQRARARQRPCANWTLTAYQRQTARSLTISYRFVCQ
jgi:multidrug resistance efflux pump